jgi:hypothetical protein
LFHEACTLGLAGDPAALKKSSAFCGKAGTVRQIVNIKTDILLSNFIGVSL